MATIKAHSPDATVAYRGHIEEPAHHDLTRRQDRTGNVDHDSPVFGPGHERSAAQVIADSRGHESRLDVTYGLVDQGTWNEDHMSGVHAFVSVDGFDAHYGYQEAWGVELPNDRVLDVERVVPWDHGLSAPAVSSEFRV